ncbi:BON domain-containing protein [Piscinibacter sp. HJYY11]|uniref:BON domain-containing protein n=1 Tax=Piscinibacter sp. HJYY11 TaxID=2801333 RepID=UPI00191E1FE6|nr:BON domain-containing protein [Piscinibacter sp. HJYY11]MBL0729317.1 BON domain-containing protein [Piscinibacter sp. HJYY11]
MTRQPSRAKPIRTAFVVSLLAATTALSGCAALLVGGAVVGGSLLVTDRRSSGTQLDDQAIEFRANSRIRDILGDRGHVNATSYNRLLLLTGEVPSDADRANLEQALSRIDNVKSVVNELAVMTASSLSQRSNDALITTKVKATLVDAGDISSNAFKVFTERGIVYLMGRVTEREAERASDLTRSISGVQKVVKVLEIVSDAELAEIDPKAVPKSAAAK